MAGSFVRDVNAERYVVQQRRENLERDIDELELKSEMMTAELGLSQAKAGIWWSSGDFSFQQ